MTESIDQMVSRIDERTKATKENVQDIKDLLAVKVVEDERKFGERPTRKELYKKITIFLLAAGLFLTALGIGVNMAANQENKNADTKTETRRE